MYMSRFVIGDSDQCVIAHRVSARPGAAAARPAIGAAGAH